MSDSPLKQNKIVPLGKLRPHPRNFRNHTDSQINKLVSSLTRFGQGRSIVIQDGPEGYLVVAGHGIVEAAKKLQYTELRADILPANWTTEQIEGYLVVDNLGSQEAQDDSEVLAQLLQEQQDAGFDLASLGTDDEYLRQLLEGLGDEYLGESEGEEDDFDEEQTRVKLGDVWTLGRHTIACMDSTIQETYEKLLKNVDINFVWSDPPYGVEIVGKDGHLAGDSDMSRAKKKFRNGINTTATVYAPVVGDDSTDTAISSSDLCLKFFPKALQIWWGANYYAQVLPHSSCWIVWDKENTGNFADAVLAWCNDKSSVRIFKHMWNGMLKGSEGGQKRVHPTQKPIKLAEWAFEKYGSEQDIIFDPFLGSGISVIAAENLSGERKVIGCELSPAYIDVCITRWEQLTNKQAQLLERAEEVVHA